MAVRAQDLAGAAAHLAGRLDGAGYVVCLRHGLDAGVLAGAAGPGRVAAAYAAFDAAELEPGVVRLGDQATLLVGELDGLSTERMRLLASHIPGAQVTEDILGCLQSGLARDAVLAVTAVGDRPAAEVLGDPRYRPLLLEVARQVLAGAPVPPAPAGGFDPSDLPGSLARLEQASRRSANTHSEFYLDLAVRHRPADLPAVLGERGGPLVRRLAELLRAIEQGRRWCRRRTSTCWPRTSGWNGSAGRSTRSARRSARRTGPAPGRWPGARSASRTSSRWPACRPAAAARPATPAGRGDAVLVRRLREAGAEVFATTQCLEYAAGFAHPEVGDTRNPRDPSRTSGGSSGGSAALVAAGVCDLALGTDTGGSVRIPAAYCGVVGLKPSYGLLPLEGVFPLSPSCDHAGTLTATVAGAADLLAVLAGAASPDAARPRDGPASPSPTLAPQRSPSASSWPSWATRRSRRRSATPSAPRWPRSPRPDGGSRS